MVLSPSSRIPKRRCDALEKGGPVTLADNSYGSPFPLVFHDDLDLPTKARMGPIAARQHAEYQVIELWRGLLQNATATLDDKTFAMLARTIEKVSRQAKGATCEFHLGRRHVDRKCGTGNGRIRRDVARGDLLEECPEFIQLVLMQLTVEENPA